MPEKMKGVFAELKTFSQKTGEVVKTELVFRPFCDWARTDDFPGHNVIWGTTYGDVEAAIKDFGLAAVTKATEGEVVEVETEIPEKYELLSCHTDERFVKDSYSIKYPYAGVKETLIRKSKSYPTGGNPHNPGRLSVPERHQLKIAKDTLKMSDAGAMIMGGPTKEQAREIIKRLESKK